MEDTQFTVILNFAIEEALENLLSPMDELEFLSQIEHQLPKMHRSTKSSRFRWFRRPSLRNYRGLADWCGIHFLYVEFDRHLHILRFEPSCDDDRHQADTLLGEPDSNGVSIVDHGNGVFIASC